MAPAVATSAVCSYPWLTWAATSASKIHPSCQPGLIGRRELLTACHSLTHWSAGAPLRGGLLRAGRGREAEADAITASLTCWRRITHMLTPHHSPAGPPLRGGLLRTRRGREAQADADTASLTCWHRITRSQERRFAEAFSALAEAVKLKRESWQTWSNYAHAAVQTRNLLPAARGILQVTGPPYAPTRSSRAILAESIRPSGARETNWGHVALSTTSPQIVRVWCGALLRWVASGSWGIVWAGHCSARAVCECSLCCAGIGTVWRPARRGGPDSCAGGRSGGRPQGCRHVQGGDARYPLISAPQHHQWPCGRSAWQPEWLRKLRLSASCDICGAPAAVYRIAPDRKLRFLQSFGLRQLLLMSLGIASLSRLLICWCLLATSINIVTDWLTALQLLQRGQRLPETRRCSWSRRSGTCSSRAARPLQVRTALSGPCTRTTMKPWGSLPALGRRCSSRCAPCSWLLAIILVTPVRRGSAISSGGQVAVLMWDEALGFHASSRKALLDLICSSSIGAAVLPLCEVLRFWHHCNSHGQAADLTGICTFFLGAQPCGFRALEMRSLPPAGEGPAGQRLAEGCAAVPGVWHSNQEIRRGADAGCLQGPAACEGALPSEAAPEGRPETGQQALAPCSDAWACASTACTASIAALAKGGNSLSTQQTSMSMVSSWDLDTLAIQAGLWVELTWLSHMGRC